MAVMSEIPKQVEATDLAIHLIRVLREKHGPLMFHQSGGCCDGSSPMCYPRGEFMVGVYEKVIKVKADVAAVLV
jgi:uncharacterized protein